MSASAGRPPSALSLPTNSCALLEGVDKNKDQSYFLALLSQEQLRDARFPIGHLTKPELRASPPTRTRPPRARKDSQGICFIGEVKMQDFLRAYVPDAPGPDRPRDRRPRSAEHRGLHYYTIGQRKGIGIPSNTDFKAYVVTGKRAADHALLVAFDAPDAPGLFVREVRVQALSWIGEPVTEARPLEGRVRYRDPRVPLEFFPEGDGTARSAFRTPQRALASGQILALYEGEQLLGGGCTPDGRARRRRRPCAISPRVARARRTPRPSRITPMTRSNQCPQRRNAARTRSCEKKSDTSVNQPIVDSAIHTP
jgi:tRNA-specific 2-thiouridylase